MIQIPFQNLEGKESRNIVNRSLLGGRKSRGGEVKRKSRFATIFLKLFALQVYTKVSFLLRNILKVSNIFLSFLVIILEFSDSDQDCYLW